MLTASCCAVFAEASDFTELTGRWKAETFLAEREDGLLVVPEAYYAYPHMGISEIRILDSGFIIFQMDGREYRAFYEPLMLDYDNVLLICSFKDGEELMLKLSAIADGWKYLIRISSDSIMAADEDSEADDETAETDEPVVVELEGDSGEAADTVSERLFTGILRKIQ